MKTFSGWIIRKEYFKIEIQADTWKEAEEKSWEIEIEGDPVDTGWEVYDLEEVKE